MAIVITGTDGKQYYVVDDCCDNNMQPVNALNFITPQPIPQKGSIEYYDVSFIKKILPPGTAGQVIGYVADTVENGGGIKLAAVNQTSLGITNLSLTVGSSSTSAQIGSSTGIGIPFASFFSVAPSLDSVGKVILPTVGATNLSFVAGSSSSSSQIGSSTGTSVTVSSFFSGTLTYDSQGKLILPSASITTETDPTALKRAGLVNDRLVYADINTATTGTVQQTTTTKTALDGAIGTTYSNGQTLDTRLTSQENKSTITRVGILPTGGSSSGTAVTLSSSNLPLLVKDGDYYIAQANGWYSLPSPVGIRDINLGDKVLFNAGDNEYILIPAGDNQNASEVTFTQIFADTNHVSIPSPNVQSALNDVSVVLKSLQIALSLSDGFVFPLNSILNGNYGDYNSVSNGISGLNPISLQISKTAILSEAPDLFLTATSGTLPALTINICKLASDGTLDTSASGILYSYTIPSTSTATVSQRYVATLNSTVSNRTFAGSYNSLGVQIIGATTILTTEAFVILPPLFQVQ